MDLGELRQMQALPLRMKIRKTVARLSEFYDYYDGEVALSFSGGIDSTVLLDIARRAYPDIKAVFSNTGVEFRDVVDFVKTKENVDIVRPEHSFVWVTKTYGWPLISKKVSRYISDCQNPTETNEHTRWLRLHGITASGEIKKSFMIPLKWQYLINSGIRISDKCCDILKKKPLDAYRKQTGYRTITAEMAEESDRREKNYIRTGCNNFSQKNAKSMPMGFWTRQDILHYIRAFNVPYCSKKYGAIFYTPETGLYSNSGEQRTGCYVCPFGVHLETCPNRYQRMAGSPEYSFCQNIGLWPVLDAIKVKYD